MSSLRVEVNKEEKSYENKVKHPIISTTEELHYHGVINVKVDGVPLWEPIPYPSESLDSLDSYSRLSGFPSKFNEARSDSLPLNRTPNDLRSKACKVKVYNLNNLPSISVIIAFYNEPFSVLMRTIHSLLNTSPPELLNEIILVDDFSTLEYVHRKYPNIPSQLEQYISHLPKVRLLKPPEKLYVSKARSFGIENSTSDYFIVLDSHVEANVGWLEPLLDRLKNNPKLLITPIVNSINSDTFEFDHVNSNTQNIGLKWIFGEHNFPKHMMNNVVNPITLTSKAPILLGGLYAGHKKFFIEMGASNHLFEYLRWENVELSFRYWLCGGEIESSICSIFYHVYRVTGYIYIPEDAVTRNKLYLADIWMDEYAPFFKKLHHLDNERVNIPQETLQQYRKPHCKGLKYFMTTVWPESKIYDIKKDIPYLGPIKNKATGLYIQHRINLSANANHRYGFIVSTDNDDNCLGVQLTIQHCDTINNLSKWYYTKSKVIALITNASLFEKIIDPNSNNPSFKLGKISTTCLSVNLSTSELILENCELHWEDKTNFDIVTRDSDISHLIWEWDSFSSSN